MGMSYAPRYSAELSKGDHLIERDLMNNGCILVTKGEGRLIPSAGTFMWPKLLNGDLGILPSCEWSWPRVRTMNSSRRVDS
jgi:hypothetical protein